MDRLDPSRRDLDELIRLVPQVFASRIVRATHGHVAHVIIDGTGPQALCTFVPRGLRPRRRQHQLRRPVIRPTSFWSPAPAAEQCLRACNKCLMRARQRALTEQRKPT